jgi:5'(3')-deoxyribonucleotidase
MLPSFVMGGRLLLSIPAKQQEPTVMKRIAIDMDEVIADFNFKFIASFNARFGESITLSDLAGKTVEQFRPHLVEEMREMICEESFFRDMPVIPNSQRVVRALQDRYEIFITSAAMDWPGSFNSKYYWLQEYFPFISPKHIVFCGNKSIVHADYLIDDTPRHFATFRGEGILFSAPHNLGTEGFRRVIDWREVETLFLS